MCIVSSKVKYRLLIYVAVNKMLRAEALRTNSLG